MGKKTEQPLMAHLNKEGTQHVNLDGREEFMTMVPVKSLEWEHSVQSPAKDLLPLLRSWRKAKYKLVRNIPRYDETF